MTTKASSPHSNLKKIDFSMISSNIIYKIPEKSPTSRPKNPIRKVNLLYPSQSPSFKAPKINLTTLDRPFHIDDPFPSSTKSCLSDLRTTPSIFDSKSGLVSQALSPKKLRIKISPRDEMSSPFSHLRDCSPKTNQSAISQSKFLAKRRVKLITRSQKTEESGISGLSFQEKRSPQQRSIERAKMIEDYTTKKIKLQTHKGRLQNALKKVISSSTKYQAFITEPNRHNNEKESSQVKGDDSPSHKLYKSIRSRYIFEPTQETAIKESLNVKIRPFVLENLDVSQIQARQFLSDRFARRKINVFHYNEQIILSSPKNYLNVK